MSQQTYELKPLPYAYDALEPYIDAATMQVHYDKHHRGYFNNFVAVMDESKAEKKPLPEIFKNMAQYSDKVRNMGGGYWNHEFFWESMTPDKSTVPSEELMKLFERDFAGFESFKTEFSKKALAVFGSGWTWLILTEDKKLKIVNTPNQDNPLMSISPEKGYPLLAVDVWEHAYYLKHKNLRADYISDFLKVVNWKKVSERLVSK